MVLILAVGVPITTLFSQPYEGSWLNITRVLSRPHYQGRKKVEQSHVRPVLSGGIH